MSGHVIGGKYEVAGLLGEGGMASVYEATHLATGRRVAVKVLRAEYVEQSEEVVDRFQREARIIGAIDTPHIVQILDAGRDEATFSSFIVMELLRGEDLAQFVKRVGPLPAELALKIAAQALGGLVRAHAAGVTHRDIKPANLFLARQGGAVTVKVLDFGIAKVRRDDLGTPNEHGLTQTGSVIGSPRYMSPEQAKGLRTLDQRTDIWSLGCVLYESLCGRTPLSGSETLGQIIVSLCSTPPAPVQDFAPWVRPETAALVHRCLRIDPGERFQTAEDMLDALRKLLPAGVDLREDLLHPLSQEERTNQAPRTLTSAITSSQGMAAPPPEYPEEEGRAAALAAMRTPREPASMGLAVMLMLLMVVGGVAFLAYKAVRKAAGAIDDIGTYQDTSPGTAVGPAASGTGAREILTAYLGITPPNASVEVDGVPVEVDHGAVTLTGAAGSVHAVRLFLGSRQTVDQVTMTEVGPSPPRLALGARASSPRARGDGGAAKGP